MEQFATTSSSFIKPLSFHISSNAIFGTLSILGLGLFTYLTNRYLNTDKETTNQYYTKTEESIPGAPNLNLTTGIGLNNIVYIFWNGDLNSTYLLIDLLLQDKVIQPLYIERYTILKSLEYDNLVKLTKQYNDILHNNKDNKDNRNAYSNTKIKKYLEDVARIKNNQTNEITQLEIFRKIILKQYPEFQKNLLPTQYITTITKDLQHTSNFFNILKTISPLYYNGIEFIEQITRFIKYYKPIKKTNYKTNYSVENDILQNRITQNRITQNRILLGYTKDNKNIDLINKIFNTIPNTIPNTIFDMIPNIKKSILEDIKIEIPLKDISNQDVKYLAANLFSNDIIKLVL